MEGGPSIQDDENLISNPEEAETMTCDNACCNPRGKFHRFVALIFMCFLGFGSYFCYDNPAALQNNFIKDLNITTTQFVLFYSLYSWPTVIVCIIGGFLIDRVFGIRLGASLYMGITLIGQIVFATGALFDTFWIMALGRFIFGIGAEPLAVAQNSYAVLWFKGKELNMVFGLQLSFARFGSTVNFWVMEPIYNGISSSCTNLHECLGIVLFIAAITCIFSMLCSLILGCLDKRAERILRRNETATSEVVRLTDIKDFKSTFWLITVICVAYYVAIFTFIALGKVFFMTKFHLPSQSANFVDSIVYLISAFASPFLGLLVDKTGKNIFWILLSVVTTIGAHMLLAFTMLNPYFGMILMGVAYSMLASSLWPLVSLIIPEYQLGTAYGICQAIQNLGLAVAAIIAGLIVDSYGHMWLEVFFIANLGVALLASLAILIVNSGTNGILNMTPSQREKHQQNVLAAEVLEREKLLSSGASSAVSPRDLLQSSDFHIRNRYLSRIGAPLPESYDINAKGLVFRALR